LLACNAMDFDDLIMLPVRLFRAQPAICDKWQGHMQYLLVDEYQDTNTSQYELIKLLCAVRQKLTVVGDDDQSIYAWRGARPENIELLRRDFPSIRVIKLEQNYRSSGRILHTANTLIANNQHLFEKKLWSASGSGEFIHVLPCKNADDEANRVAIDILSQHLQEGSAYRNFAILYRSNFQSRGYEKALRDHSIPYQVSGGTAFFERREIKDIMAYLRLISNPDDDQALLRIINIPRREIGSSTLKTVASHAQKRHCPLDTALHQTGMNAALGSRARNRIQQFVSLIDALREQLRDYDAMTFCNHLIAELDYEDWLQQTSSSRKQAEVAIENVLELFSWIGNLQKNRDDSDLASLVSHLSLMSILENNEQNSEQDAVQLSTFHAAKGLEFPRVYLVGFEEDSLPHHQSQDVDGIEEERRLAYVGITRAQSSLTISYAKLRQKFGEIRHCEPSRFLYELPESELEGAEHIASKMTSEEKHQQGLDTFADLKAMLGTVN